MVWYNAYVVNAKFYMNVLEVITYINVFGTIASNCDVLVVFFYYYYFNNFFSSNCRKKRV